MKWNHLRWQTMIEALNRTSKLLHLAYVAKSACFLWSKTNKQLTGSLESELTKDLPKVCEVKAKVDIPLLF